MKNKQINVIVAGPVSSGRSSIAAEITRVLRNHGTTVKLTMDPDFKNETAYLAKSSNIERVARTTEVTVTAVQTKLANVTSDDSEINALAHKAAVNFLQLSGYHRSSDAEYRTIQKYATIFEVCKAAVNSGIKHSEKTITIK